MRYLVAPLLLAVLAVGVALGTAVSLLLLCPCGLGGYGTTDTPDTPTTMEAPP